MNDLPDEVLALVFLALNPQDRLNSALVCRRWARVMSSSEMLEDIRLDIDSFEMNVAASVLSRSSRQHRNLRLCEADLREENFVFWNTVGGSLRELELIYGIWSDTALSNILRLCPKLEIIKFGSEEWTQGALDSIFGVSVGPGSLCTCEIRFHSRGGTSRSGIRSSEICDGRRNGPGDQTCQLLDITRRVAPEAKSPRRDISPFFDYSGVWDRRPGAMPEVASLTLSIPGRDDTPKRPRFPGPRVEIHNLNTDHERPNTQWTDQIAKCSETLQRLWEYVRELRDHPDRITNVCTKLHHLPSSTDSDCDQVYCLINLESLEIDCKDSTENTLSEILKVKGLRRLDLHNVKSLSNEFLRAPATTSALQYLELHGCAVTVSVMRSLSSLKGLKGLSLDPPESGGVNSECFDVICESFRNLEELRLVDHSILTDADGVKLRRFKNLRKLSLSGVDNITDMTFEKGLGSPYLTELQLSHCPLTDAGLTGLASNHKMVREISLDHCHNITDDGILLLLENETLLQELLVEDCRSLGDRWTGKLEDLCPRLRCLYASQYNFSQFCAKRPAVMVW